MALWGVAREPLGLLEALWASFAGVANDSVLVARPLASPIFSAALGWLFSPAFGFGRPFGFGVPFGLMFGPLALVLLAVGGVRGSMYQGGVGGWLTSGMFYSSIMSSKSSGVCGPHGGHETDGG